MAGDVVTNAAQNNVALGIAPPVPASDAGKLQMLQAAATGGQNGMNDYATASNDIGSAQNQALAAAASRAGALNAPSTFIAKQNAAVALPGNAALPELNALQQAQTGYLGALRSANSQYLAAVPKESSLLQSQAAAAIPGMQSTAYSKALNDALTVQNQQDELVTKQQANSDKLSAATIKQQQEQNYQELSNPNSAYYSPQTQATAKYILGNATSIDQALDQINNHTVTVPELDSKGKQKVDSTGKPVFQQVKQPLSASDWASKGVDTAALNRIIQIQLNPKQWFQNNPLPLADGSLTSNH